MTETKHPAQGSPSPEIKVDPEDMQGIHELIGASVYYWARALTDKEWATTNADRAVVEDATGKIITWDDSAIAAMLKSVLEIAPQTFAAEYVRDAISETDERGYIDAAYIDGEAADVMLQCWALGEVRYG